MLDVGEPAEAGREQLLLVGDAVVVGVGELPHLVGVRLHRQHRVGAERHDEAREDQLVDEDAVRLVLAVVVAVLVHRDAADRIELAGGVGVLHVAAQLEHEHPAVAVEGDLRGLLDVGIGEHRLQLEARAAARIFLASSSRRQHRDRRLGDRSRRSRWRDRFPAARPDRRGRRGRPAARAPGRRLRGARGGLLRPGRRCGRLRRRPETVATRTAPAIVERRDRATTLLHRITPLIRRDSPDVRSAPL